MTRNRATIEATGNTVRGPWEEQPLRPSLPVAVRRPILALSSATSALVVASQNAYPIVATRKTAPRQSRPRGRRSDRACARLS